MYCCCNNIEVLGVSVLTKQDSSCPVFRLLPSRRQRALSSQLTASVCPSETDIFEGVSPQTQCFDARGAPQTTRHLRWSTARPHPCLRPMSKVEGERERERERGVMFNWRWRSAEECEAPGSASGFSFLVPCLGGFDTWRNCQNGFLNWVDGKAKVGGTIGHSRRQLLWLPRPLLQRR